VPPVLVVSGEALGSSPAGPALRAAGLARALERRGHEVLMAAPAPHEAPPGWRVVPLRAIQGLVEHCRCAIVSGFQLERHPELARAPALCVDLAGPFLIENLWVHRAEPPDRRRRILAEEADVVGRLLEQADHVLCANERQRDLLLGLLLGHAALRPELLDGDPTLDGTFEILPFGAPEGDPPSRPPRPARGPLRLLWPGGQWAWLDVETLTAGVELARAAGADVELELWGGSVWVPYAERVPRLQAADLAVTLDVGGIEARFAFRTRLLDALWAGVPILATAGEHVADEAAAAGAGFTVPPGDARAVAERLQALAADRTALEAAAARTQAVAARYRYDDLVENLSRFCANPVRRRPGPFRRTLRERAGYAAGRLRQKVGP
jgi:glycosyltransferase involved in cell wall biosynthesis